MGEGKALRAHNIHTCAQILQNIIDSPQEPKYRRLRTSNNKIAMLLATQGVRALLIGAGFVEETDALVLPIEAEVDSVVAAITGLQALAAERAQGEAQQKLLELEKRKEKNADDIEKRKQLKAQVRLGALCHSSFCAL